MIGHPQTQVGIRTVQMSRLFLEVFLMGKRQCRKGAHRFCAHRHAVWRSLAGADAFGLRGPGLLVLLWGKGLFTKVRGQTVAPTLRHPRGGVAYRRVILFEIQAVDAKSPFLDAIPIKTPLYRGFPIATGWCPQL
jgi:hypothetical protein